MKSFSFILLKKADVDGVDWFRLFKLHQGTIFSSGCNCILIKFK